MQKQTGGELTIENAGFYAAKQGEAPALGGMEILGVGEIQQGMTVLDSYPDLELDDNIVVGGEGQTYCHTHSNSLSNKMGNSLLAVRGINHKYIVVVESGSEEYNSKYNTTFFYPSRRQYDLNDVLEIERKYDELEKNLPTLYELGQGLHRLKADKKRIGWEISTPLHKHTKILLHKMKNEVVKNNINFLSKEYRIIIRKQLELIDNILELDFEKYEEINQYCVALRSKAILIVFLFGEKRYGEIIRHLSKAIEIYLKESSIDGIVSCIYLSSTIYFLLYLQTQKYYYLVYSTKALNDVGKMVNICMSGKLAEYIKEEKLWKESCLKLKK